MSSSDEEDSYSGSRWEELKTGSSLLCLKCQKKVSEKDQVVACRMVPSYVLDTDDDHPSGCLNILCRDCATSDPRPFQPCQCFTLGDQERYIWCPDCTKSFKKCNACRGLLCQYCQVDTTKHYGLLCQHCSWAMSELLGRLPEGVTVGCAPWHRYVTPENIKTAVRRLHDEALGSKTNSRKIRCRYGAATVHVCTPPHGRGSLPRVCRGKCCWSIFRQIIGSKRCKDQV